MSSPVLLPSIPNLVSTSADFVCPWLFPGDAIPAEVRGPKAKVKRTAWQTTPDTVHNFFSGWEGLTPSSRISDKQDGNPPYKLHAIVADYDAPLSEEEIVNGITRMGEFVPTYFGRSLSGNVHVVWLLEQPVIVPSFAFAAELMRFIAKRMGVDRFGVKLDGPAFSNPGKYYCNGCDWSAIQGEPKISKSMAQGWVMEVAESFSFRDNSSGVQIPLDVVWEELQKKFPQAQWPTDFVEGSTGPSFWVEGSSSPKSAIVKPEGMYTFAAHATKAWWSWRDLLGAQFVDGYESKSLGAAVENIFFDGKNYWRLDGQNNWGPYSKEDTASHLVISRNVPKSAPKGQPSVVDRCLEHIRHWSKINGACPFVFKPSGMVRVGQTSMLNTFTKRVLPPADGVVEWGDNGQMPFISSLVDGLLASEEQRQSLLSWLHRFYASAHECNIQSGQNIFIVGGAGVGKTLFSTRVVAPLVGGHATAEDYLMGQTAFNSQLFDSALWTIDDNSAAVDAASHRKFSTIIKRMAANTTFEYHAKFQVPCQVVWQGRVIVTMNADEESIRMLPDLDISILDKISIFKAADKPRKFPKSTEIEKLLQRELPYFARYLLDYVVPEDCVGASRYGIMSYHEKSLMRTAHYSSRSYAFAEMIDDWRTEYFEDHKEDWKGTSYQLLHQMSKDPARASTLRGITAPQIAQQLANLKNRGYALECDETSQGRIWTIRRQK